MDTSSRVTSSTRESEENRRQRDQPSGLSPTTKPKSIRECDAEIQELKRENFNLKLRIYFLEERSDSGSLTGVQQNLSTSQIQYGTSITQDISNTAGQYQRLPTASSHQSTQQQTTTIQSTGDNNQFVQITTELERCRKENEKLRQQLAEISKKLDNQLIQSTEHPGSEMPVSNLTLHFSDHAKLLEENKSLRAELEFTKRSTDTNNELKRLKEQYANEIKIYQERQVKADNVLKHYKQDCEAYKSKLNEDFQKKLAELENYRHEPLLARIRFSYPLKDKTDDNVNIEEYRQRIEEKDREIFELKEIIQRLKKQFTLTSSSIDPQYSPQNFQRLRDQIDSYVEMINKLRLECNTLQENEKYLRNEINKLNHLFDSRQITETPSRPVSMIIEDPHQLEELQTLVVDVKSQLRSDGSNLTELGSRVTERMRELKAAKSLIQEHESTIQTLEQRISQNEIILIERNRFEQQLRNAEYLSTTLTKENETLNLHIQEDAERIQNLRREKEQCDEQCLKLQRETQANEKKVSIIETQLIEKQQEYHSLQQDWQKRIEVLKTTNDEYKSDIQNLTKQIDKNVVQYQQLETTFEQERKQLQQQIQLERNKFENLQIEINSQQTRYKDFETERSQLQRKFEDQQETFNREIRIYKTQINQLEQESIEKKEEFQLITNENQIIEATLRQRQDELNRSEQIIDELKRDMTSYVERFNECEKEKQRYQYKLDTLQTEYDNMIRNHQTDLNNLNLWKQKFDETQSILYTTQAKLRRYENEAENNNFQRENEHLNIEIKRVNEEILTINRRYVEIENQFRSANLTIEELQQKVSEQLRQLRIQNVHISELQNDLHDRENLIESLQTHQLDNDVQLEIQIRIQQLEQDLEEKQNIIQTFTETVETKDSHIEKLLENLKQDNNKYTSAINILQTDIQTYKRQIEDLELERVSLQRNYKQEINQLQTRVDDLQQQKRSSRTDESFHEQQHLIVQSTITIEEKQFYLQRIKDLEDQVEEMKKRLSSTISSKFDDNYQAIIDDLKLKLEDRQKRIEKLEDSVDKYKRREEETHLIKIRTDRDQSQIEDSGRTSMFTVRDRSETIAELQKKLLEREHEINKLRDNDLGRDKTINELRSKLITISSDSRTSFNEDSTNLLVECQSKLEKKDQELKELQRRLDETLQRLIRPVEENLVSTQQHQNFDQLSRDELLYELRMISQYNQDLTQQLRQKFPSITELHSQLVEIRNELERQRYVNQVLWRTINTLTDIYGSSTVSNLHKELANYQDELAKLKSQNPRTTNNRSTLNANSRSSSETSLGKKDSAISSATDTNEYQRQIQEKDEQIQQLRTNYTKLEKAYNDADRQYRNDYDKMRLHLTDEVSKYRNQLENIQQIEDDFRIKNEIKTLQNDLNKTQNELNKTRNDLQQAYSQINSFEISNEKFHQAEEENHKLQIEIKRLKTELDHNRPLIERYKTQLQISEENFDNKRRDILLQSNELTQLLEEMPLLRRDLERNIEQQNVLHNKLDENIRQIRSPREFTFSGRGVSYPDLRLVDSPGLISAENISVTSKIDEIHLKPLTETSSLITTDVERSTKINVKNYIIGEIEIHNNLRRLIEDIKFDLKGTVPQLREILRSKSNSSTIDERLNSLDERLSHALDLIETYWKADLPEKNLNDEHLFVDVRLIEENKRLLLLQKKYIQDIMLIKKKYKEQSDYINQLLAEITKTNRKKADTGEYLALLLRPTLDVIQKARTNIEHHLKETNINNVPPGSAQSHRRRRHHHQN